VAIGFLNVQVAGGTPVPFTELALEHAASKAKLNARTQLFILIIRMVSIARECFESSAAEALGASTDRRTQCLPSATNPDSA
jgi:hypothetical protein